MKYLLLLLFFPFKVFGQDITGLWVGRLYNDTTKMSLHYEVAITENKGKYTGFSYTTFIVDNQEITGVKSLKIVKQKDHYFFEDIDLLYNNYPSPPPKGVKQISSVSLSETDSAKVLSGKFITTRTREYGRQVTGTVRLERIKDSSKSKLVAVLNKINSAPVVATVKQPTSVPTRQEERKNVLDELRKRTVETIQTVYFSNDSLELSVYDNGFVDGDSISIIVNGKVLLEHQGLSTRAVSKTIRTGSVDSFNIVMLAENLGSIAPNTGLLVIYDGAKRHEIMFSGDLQKNAGILLKRRKQ